MPFLLYLEEIECVIMGCKCKEDSEKVGKYTDDGKPALEPLRGFRKVLSVILRVLLGILLFSLVIITLPFVVIYVIFMAIFGKTVKINLKKLFRLNVGK